MRLFALILSLFFGSGLSGQSPAPKPTPAQPATPTTPLAKASDKVVLTVGDEKMTAAQFEEFIDALPEQYRTAARGPGRRQVVDQLVSLKTLAQEARRRKIDQSMAFRAQQAFQSENLLAGTLFRELSSSLKVTEADGRKYYDQHKSEYERVKARHILIRFKGSPVPVGEKKDLTEEEALEKAKALRARIVGGADLATLAKAESDDTQSGANGGDLDFFNRGAMTPPFDQAAFALPVGEISEPVKTQFGYHLILVEKHETKSFDEMRPEIEKLLLPELSKQAIEKLKSQTPVQIDEAYFGPAQAQ